MVEETHRAGRRLFRLTGLAPLGDAVRPPYRLEPGRGRPVQQRFDDAADLPSAPSPLRPLTRIERREFDCTAFEEAMVHMAGDERWSKSVV